MNKMIKGFAAAASLMLGTAAAQASSFSGLTIFGDSLSDTGNLAVLQEGAPERFTNGPVAVEIVGGALGFSVSPSYHLVPGAPNGNNYAIAGAKAIDEDGDESTPDINLPTQVNSYLMMNGGQADANALYVVLIGGNDIRAARDIRSGVVFAETGEERRAIRQAARDSINTAVESQIAQIEKLINAGAENILVINAPDIGAIPETDLATMQLLANAQTVSQQRKAQRLPQVTTKLSAKYNKKLARKLARLEHRTGVDLIEFDLFGFIGEQIAGGEDYGYTNTDDACIYIFSQAGAVNPECSDFPVATGFVFWDEIHATTVPQQRAGQEMVQTILSH